MTKLILLSLLFSVSARAQDAETTPDFDSLGGNTILLQRAKALEPEKDLRIIQGRTVDRRHRVEIAPEFAGTFGGDSYVQSKAVGLNLNYHFTPRFSVGLKYNYNFNSLTSEGENMYNAALAEYYADPENPTAPYPEVDYVKDQALALVNWYPFYGKMNVFDHVVQFDFYALGGWGQMRLRSGPTETYTAGGGVGFWITQHFSTRLEMRYQNYTAKYINSERDMDLTIGSVQMGWIL